MKCVNFFSFFNVDVATDSNIQDIGILSGVPNFLGLGGLLLAGFLSDYLRANKIMTVTNVSEFYPRVISQIAIFPFIRYLFLPFSFPKGHKTFVTVTQIMTTVLLFTAGQWESPLVCNICICLYRFFSAFEYLSFK